VNSFVDCPARLGPYILPLNGVFDCFQPTFKLFFVGELAAELAA